MTTFTPILLTKEERDLLISEMRQSIETLAAGDAPVGSEAEDLDLEWFDPVEWDHVTKCKDIINKLKE